jgi:2'-5' RNA ligase
MADQEKLRLFVAFDVPEEHRRALQDVVAPLREKFSGIRWTKVENQHITLKFLGWVPSARRSDVEEVCRGVSERSAPAVLSLTELGIFPGPKRARVLWAGIDDPTGLTPRLAADLDAGFRPLGFEPEERGFTPHLTLARLKQPQRLGELPQVPLEVRGTFSLDEMRLYRSHLSPKGARYEVIERFALGSKSNPNVEVIEEP